MSVMEVAHKNDENKKRKRMRIFFFFGSNVKASKIAWGSELYKMRTYLMKMERTRLLQYVHK